VNIIAKTGLGINEKYIMEKVGVVLTVEKMVETCLLWFLDVWRLEPCRESKSVERKLNC